MMRLHFMVMYACTLQYLLSTHICSSTVLDLSKQAVMALMAQQTEKIVLTHRQQDALRSIKERLAQQNLLTPTIETACRNLLQPGDAIALSELYHGLQELSDVLPKMTHQPYVAYHDLFAQKLSQEMESAPITRAPHQKLLTTERTTRPGPSTLTGKTSGLPAFTQYVQIAIQDTIDRMTNTGLVVNTLTVAEDFRLSSSINGALVATNGLVTGKTLTSTDTPNTVVERDSAGRFQAAAPSTGADVANKTYVDNAVSVVIQPKEPCQGFSNTNITLADLQTLDDYGLLENDRVLVIGQTNKVENGIYIAHATNWERATDMAAGTNAQGVYTAIINGTVYANRGYICTTARPSDIVGTDELTFQLMTMAVGLDRKTGDISNFKTIAAATPANNATLVKTNATATNAPNTLVARNSSGNFSAGTINATVSGNVIGDVTGNLRGNLTGNINSPTCTAKGNLQIDGTTRLATTLTGVLKAHNGTVSASQIAHGEIAAEAVDANALADDAVTTSKIADSTITTRKLVGYAIETNKIADLNVTGAKIAASTITHDKLAGNIPDTLLNTISTGGKVSNSATTATPRAAANAIVVRDDNGDFSARTIKLTGAVSAATDAATKAYVDANAQGLNVKRACRAYAGTELVLTGTQIIDGVTLATNDRVLVNGQTAPGNVDNGIWLVQLGCWIRPPDFSVGDSATGAFTFIQSGATYGNSGWVCSSKPAIIGTNALEFTQFSSAGATELANVGTGIGQIYSTRAGSTFNVKTINAGTNISISNDTNEVTIALPNTITLSGDLTVGGTMTLTGLHGVLKAHAGTLSASTITNSEIATDAVRTINIQDEAITQDKLATRAVTATKIALGGVHTDNIADLSITGSKIVTHAITPDKLSGAIPDTLLNTISTAGKVANSATSAVSTNTPNTIVSRDSSGNFAAHTISADTVIATLQGNVTGQVTGNVVGNLIGNITGSTTIGGDVTVAGNMRLGVLNGIVHANSGALSASLIESADIASSAITNTQLAPDAVTQDKILNNTITYNKLAGNIPDVLLSTISTPGKIANSATTAMATNTPNSLVTRNADGDFSTHMIQLSGDPSNTNDVATKSYVDSVAKGINVHTPCVAATTGNIRLSGLQVIDTYITQSGDRILVKDQKNGMQNGIYRAASGCWHRATDFSVGMHARGAYVLITNGSVNKNIGFICVASDSTDIVGTNTLTFTHMTAPDTPTAQNSAEPGPYDHSVGNSWYFRGFAHGPNINVALNQNNQIEIGTTPNITIDGNFTANKGATTLNTGEGILHSSANGVISSNSIVADDIATGAVTTTKIGNQAVTQAQLATTSVGTDQLMDASVTTRKLAQFAVGTNNIADHAITCEKTTATATNMQNSLVARDSQGNFAGATITATQFLGPLAGAVTGDVTGNVNGNLTAATCTATGNLSVDGTTRLATTLTGFLKAHNGTISATNQILPNEIGENAVTNSAIADGAITTNKIRAASITQEKLSDNSIGTHQIITANITQEKLASNSVGAHQIIAANVTQEKLAHDSVGTNQIINLNVTTEKLAAHAVTIDKALTSSDVSAGTTAILASNAGTFKAKNITVSDVTPTAPDELTSKSYVDSWIATGATGANVGTGTGTIFRNKTNTFINFKTLAASNGIIITNNAHNVTISRTSDKRIQRGIKPLDATNSLATIKQLNPILFTYTPEFVKRSSVSDKEQIGLVAQDVASICPQAVDTTPDDKFGTVYGINYDGIVLHLVNSVKVLSQEIEKVKKEKQKLLHQLQMELDELRKSMRGVRKRMR